MWNSLRRHAVKPARMESGHKHETRVGPEAFPTTARLHRERVNRRYMVDQAWRDNADQTASRSSRLSHRRTGKAHPSVSVIRSPRFSHCPCQNCACTEKLSGSHEGGTDRADVCVLMAGGNREREQATRDIRESPRRGECAAGTAQLWATPIPRVCGPITIADVPSTIFDPRCPDAFDDVTHQNRFNFFPTANFSGGYSRMSLLE